LCGIRAQSGSKARRKARKKVSLKGVAYMPDYRVTFIATISDEVNEQELKQMMSVDPIVSEFLKRYTNTAVGIQPIKGLSKDFEVTDIREVDVKRV
jgi:hypothetical protein